MRILWFPLCGVGCVGSKAPSRGGGRVAGAGWLLLAGQVAPPGVLEGRPRVPANPFRPVAFALSPLGGRVHPVMREEGSQCPRRKRLAAPVRPGPLVQAVEVVQDLLGRDLLRVPCLTEAGAQIGEELHARVPRLLLDRAGKLKRRPPRRLRPGAADGIRDSEERGPIVCGPIVERLWHIRAGVAPSLQMMLRPARELPPQWREQPLEPQLPTDLLGALSGGLPAHVEDDRAVLDGGPGPR